MAIQENLALRMRPKHIRDVIGQETLLNENGYISRILKTKIPQSIILYGPPGTGKTTIAICLAESLDLPYAFFNAAIDKKEQLQKIVKQARDSKTQTLLILDEIHRLTKPNQEVLLPYLESGEIILAGATTENPFMTIQPAIRSRAKILEVDLLSLDDIVEALNFALITDPLLIEAKKEIQTEQIKQIAHASQGDLRKAYNMLELVILSSTGKTISAMDINTIIDSNGTDGDKNGDTHYNLLSAFQKSIRGSDADAALFYLAKLLQAGELVSVVRRLTVIAYEDISIADPATVTFAVTAINTAQTIGMPEAAIPLANAVTALALAQKTNIPYKAYNNAAQTAQNVPAAQIPPHLKDAHYKGAAELGHGVNYYYPHDYPNHWVPQQYLPLPLINTTFFTFDDNPATITYQNIYTALKQNQHQYLQSQSPERNE